MKEFANLKKINSDYKATVDTLTAEYNSEAVSDSSYSDALIAQRVTERNARFNERIDQAAKNAVESAAPEISSLRKALKKYITTSADPATLATLQSLIAGGVELSPAEVEAFADGAGYAVLRLLEKHSGGHIKAPKPNGMEKDIGELERHFRNARAYRGGMANATTETFWGQSAVVGSGIQQGMIDKFDRKADEIAGRLACLSANN